jgi:hypothetical protein
MLHIFISGSLQIVNEGNGCMYVMNYWGYDGYGCGMFENTVLSYVWKGLRKPTCYSLCINGVFQHCPLHSVPNGTCFGTQIYFCSKM